MDLPTSREIFEARLEIAGEGGQKSPATLALGMLILTEGLLTYLLETLAVTAESTSDSLEGCPPGMVLRAVIGSALAAGLNIGLRIGEARARQAQKEAV